MTTSSPQDDAWVCPVPGTQHCTYRPPACATCNGDNECVCGHDHHPRFPDYVAAGMPGYLSAYIPLWLNGGLTPEVVAPYMGHTGHRLIHPHAIPAYVRTGIPGHLVFAYQSAGLLDPDAIQTAAQDGYPPALISAWTAPYVTADVPFAQIEGLSHRFITVARAAQPWVHTHPDLIHTLLRVTPGGHTPDRTTLFETLLADWTQQTVRDLPSTRIEALIQAGYTPRDIQANPALRTCPMDALRTMAALRNPQVTA